MEKEEFDNFSEELQALLNKYGIEPVIRSELIFKKIDDKEGENRGEEKEIEVD